MIQPFDIEQAAAALQLACRCGDRDAVRAAVAAAQDDGLDLTTVLARTFATWPGIALQKESARDDATYRGWQWAGRYLPAPAFEPLLTASQPSDFGHGLAAAVAAGAAVAKSISEMDQRGRTPDDVRTFRLARASRERLPDEQALANLLSGRPTELALHARLLGHPTAGIRKIAMQAWRPLLHSSTTCSALLAVQPASASDEFIEALLAEGDARTQALGLRFVASNPTNWNIDRLGQLGSDEAIRLLIELLPDHQWSAVNALRQTRRERLLQLLGEAYRDPERGAELRRQNAADVAALLGGDAVPWLIEALQDPMRVARLAAELALVRLGQQAVEGLLQVLREGKAPAREHALVALAHIGERRAGPQILEAALLGPRWLRCIAIRTLPITTPDDAHEVVLALFDDRVAQVRLAAIGAAADVPSDLVVAALRERVRDPDDVQTQAAQRALLAIAQGHSLWASPAAESVVEVLLAEEPALARVIADRFASVSPRVLAAMRATLDRHLQAPKESRALVIATLDRLSIEGKPARDVALDRLGDLVSGGTSASEKYPVRAHATVIREDRQHQQSAQEEPPGPKPGATMYLSASAPSRVAVASTCIVEVWLHEDPPRYFFESHRYSQALQPLRSLGPVKAPPQGASVEVRLQVPGLEVAEPDVALVWVGSAGVAQFVVGVPTGKPPGDHVGLAVVSCSGCHVATLAFILVVVDAVPTAAAARRGDVTTEVHRVETAFASYASEDREEVLHRVQGMQKALPDLDVFLDVARLRSGEDWVARLEHEIAARDVMYLFWSRAASRSQWVDREWRLALRTRGMRFIDPVPLEDPTCAPPPPELAERHFNDWTLQMSRPQA